MTLYKTGIIETEKLKIIKSELNFHLSSHVSTHDMETNTLLSWHKVARPGPGPASGDQTVLAPASWPLHQSCSLLLLAVVSGKLRHNHTSVTSSLVNTVRYTRVLATCVHVSSHPTVCRTVLDKVIDNQQHFFLGGGL